MPIRVTGLREIQRTLKEVGDIESSRELRKALKSGAEIVAADARGRVPSRSGAAAGSIKSGTSGARAFVKGGGGVRYYGWLDFGSRHPRKGNPRSVGPWSGSGRGPEKGRFLYPARDAKQDEVLVQIEQAVGEVVRRVS